MIHALGPGAHRDPRRWIALVVLLAGAFLPPLDFFIVNVALPSIRADLHASAAVMQLIISGYATAYAVMLVTGGRLGDLYGRRNIFLIGMPPTAGTDEKAALLLRCLYGRSWAVKPLLLTFPLCGQDTWMNSSSMPLSKASGGSSVSLGSLAIVILGATATNSSAGSIASSGMLIRRERPIPPTKSFITETKAEAPSSPTNTPGRS